VDEEWLSESPFHDADREQGELEEEKDEESDGLRGPAGGSFVR